MSKLTKMGIECTHDEIVSSAFVTALYLQSIGFEKKVFLCAEKGMHDELKAIGIDSFGHEEEFFHKKVPWNEPVLCFFFTIL